MTLSTDDLHELIRLLEQHPEWRAELRRLVLTEELLSLPGLTRELADIVREMARLQQQGLERLEASQARLAGALAELAEAQRRTAERLDALAEAQRRTEQGLQQLTARLDGLAARVDELAEAQRRTEERLAALTARVHDLTVRLEQLTARVDDLTGRLEQLTARVDNLAERMERVEDQIVQLTARVDDLTVQVSVLARTMQRMADDLGKLKGWSLEERARRKAHALFRRLIRRPRLVAEERFAQLVDDAQDQGTLSPEEADRLIEADVVVRGQRPEDRSEVYLIAEVSWGIGVEDVQRARERAALAQRIGLPAEPVVVGTWVTPDAERLIQYDGTLVLLIRPDDWTP